MRIIARPLRPGELDHELIWLCVSLGALVGFLAWPRLGIPLPGCIFHALTGRPCLTCGATRCFLQLCHGRLDQALRWNPGAFAAIVGLVIYNGYAAAVLAFRLPRVRPESVTRGEANVIRAAAIALMALNWIYLLYTLP